MSRRKGKRRVRSELERMMTQPVANFPKSGEVPTEPVYAHRRPGAPTKLTREVEARLMIALRSGNNLYVAASICGLSPSTVRGWVQRGQGRLKNLPPKPEYVRFARMVHEASMASEALVVGNMVNLSRTKTEAGKFFLTRTAPERWPAVMPGEQPLPGVQGLPGPEEVDRVQVERERIVIIPLEAFPEMTRQLLAGKREQHALEMAATTTDEPYDEAPQVAHDSSLRAAGLRDEA